MISRLIAVLFLISVASTVTAQIVEVPDSSAVNGVGKVFQITNSEFINVTVESSNDVFGYIQSIPQQIIINVAKPSPEILTTTLTVSNLVPETNYMLIKNGAFEDIVTDEAGKYVFEVDLSQPQKMMIVNQQ